MDKLNITEYCLKTKAQRFPEKNALIIVDKLGSDRKFTYRELYHAVCRLAAGFKSFKLPKGSAIGVQASDTYDLLLTFLAAIAADLVPIAMLLSLVDEEVAYILKDSQARLFIQLSQSASKVQLPANCNKITVADFELLKKFLYEEIQPSTLFNDPALIFYTSGSTGKPKGVLHAQRVILGRDPSLKYWLNLRSDDIVVQTDNLCWTYSMFTGFLDPLIVGATAVVYNPSNASSLAEDALTSKMWLQLINDYKVTVMASTPDIYTLILNDENVNQYKTPSLRMVGSAGALLSEGTQKHWQDIFGMPIYLALGMTEISTFISTGALIPQRGHTIGKIQPGRKVSLLPVEGGYEDLPRNTMGMLAVHKDELGLMLGYLGEAREKSAYYRGDWFLTQDLLSMDEDGYLTYFGRIDSLLKVSGGFRVSPVQVENVIKSCKQVKDAACGAIFDEVTQSDILVAYIISDQPGQELAELICHQIKRHLTDYNMPHYLFFVNNLPYTPRGKLIRNKLSALERLFSYHERGQA